jgi:hypothetical protein
MSSVQTYTACLLRDLIEQPVLPPTLGDGTGLGASSERHLVASAASLNRSISLRRNKPLALPLPRWSRRAVYIEYTAASPVYNCTRIVSVPDPRHSELGSRYMNKIVQHRSFILMG